ncbi:MAG TPA: hypothetical protein VMX58_09675 [Patescibacteria group bacterium]|nr:hypothetical protein [Patescibacteria group bacterium]
MRINHGGPLTGASRDTLPAMHEVRRITGEGAGCRIDGPGA